jgi:hypothetical protein
MEITSDAVGHDYGPVLCPLKRTFSQDLATFEFSEDKSETLFRVLLLIEKYLMLLQLNILDINFENDKRSQK